MARDLRKSLFGCKMRVCYSPTQLASRFFVSPLSRTSIAIRSIQSGSVRPSTPWLASGIMRRLLFGKYRATFSPYLAVSPDPYCRKNQHRRVGVNRFEKISWNLTTRPHPAGARLLEHAIISRTDYPHSMGGLLLIDKRDVFRARHRQIHSVCDEIRNGRAQLLAGEKARNRHLPHDE